MSISTILESIADIVDALILWRDRRAEKRVSVSQCDFVEEVLDLATWPSCRSMQDAIDAWKSTNDCEVQLDLFHQWKLAYYAVLYEIESTPYNPFFASPEELELYKKHIAEFENETFKNLGV